MEIRRRVLAESVSEQEARFVSCLISHGTEYIDTMYKANYFHKYELDFKDSSLGRENYEGYFGSNTEEIGVIRYIGNQSVIFRYYKTQDWVNNIAIKENERTKIRVEINTIYSAGYVKTAPEPPNADTFEYSLLLFSNRVKGKLDVNGIFRLYGFKVWNESDELVFDLFPCLDVNGVPCLYNAVSKQYLYNSGTGEFGYETLEGEIVNG